MRYVMNPKVGLRSWERIPFACQTKGRQLPQILSAEMFGMLLRCDGKHDLPEVHVGADGTAPEGDDAPEAQTGSGVPTLLARALREGLAHPAEPGETWDAWCTPRSYPNRLFHSLIWAITGRCNLNCRHCFMARDNSPMMGEFSWEECLALLDECERCGVQNITITGGEPLLHTHFMDVVAEITRRGINLVELNTNGVLLTPEMLQEFRRLGQSPEIKVSFDGVGHHDWLRGVEGSEEEALAAMRMAKDAGFRVMAQTNVHRGNVAAMLDTARLLDGMGVDRIRIIRTTESPRWRENSQESTLGIVEYYDAMLDLARSLLDDDLRIAVTMWQFLSWDPATHLYHLPPAQVEHGCYRDALPVCRDARGSVSVSYTGEILPCNQMSGSFASWGVSLGNVHDTPLHELLRSGSYHDCVMMPVSEVRDHPGNEDCASCEYWRACIGGCRAIATIVTGDYRGMDPAKCAFFKGGYLAKAGEVFTQAPGSWECVNDLGDLRREGDAEGYRRALELLGPYA